MHGVPPVDSGRTIDWGHTSEDYAVFRQGPPPSFYDRLRALGVGLPGQRVLDLGTGTGVVARQLAIQACTVTGVDIAAGQIDAARRLAADARLEIDFHLVRAEETGLASQSFDVITANQSWLYFDRPRLIPEVRRLLAPGGRLVTSHFCWLPRLDPIARQTEALVLKFNPQWSAADWPGTIPACPAWAAADFIVTAMFFYDEPIPFTRESWRGRIRACRGVGASLTAEEVKQFDEEHAALLARIAEEKFTVLHRIDAHVFQPQEAP